jgi:hypothetical protein
LSECAGKVYSPVSHQQIWLTGNRETLIHKWVGLKTCKPLFHTQVASMAGCACWDVHAACPTSIVLMRPQFAEAHNILYTRQVYEYTGVRNVMWRNVISCLFSCTWYT